MKVSKQELEAVTALSPEKRYNYFVKRICDWEQVWTKQRTASSIYYCFRLKTLLNTMQQTQGE